MWYCDLKFKDYSKAPTTLIKPCEGTLTDTHFVVSKNKRYRLTDAPTHSTKEECYQHWMELLLEHIPLLQQQLKYIQGHINEELL